MTCSHDDSTINIVLILLLLLLLPLVSIPEGGLKIDDNKLKGYMMLSPCSQGPAGCRVAELH